MISVDIFAKESSENAKAKQGEGWEKGNRCSRIWKARAGFQDHMGSADVFALGKLKKIKKEGKEKSSGKRGRQVD